MLWIDPVLTLVAAVVAPFVALPVGRIGQKLRRVSISTQEQTGQMASLVSESLQGVRVAKTYGIEAYLKRRAADAFDDIRRLKMKSANARGRLDPLLEAGGGVAVAGVLVFIGWRIVDGRAARSAISRVSSAPDPGRAADPLARQPQRHRPGGDRGACSATSRSWTRSRRSATVRARATSSCGAGEIRFERVRFRYRERCAGAGGRGPRRPGGTHDGARRPLRLRQVDAARRSCRASTT